MTVFREEDIAYRHAVAWRYGKSVFGYDGELLPPKGLLVGEGPGPNTDVRLPLFPDPPGSAAARLMRFAGVTPAEYLRALACVNLCNEATWSQRKAEGNVVRLVTWLMDQPSEDGKFRVLLLGKRVAQAWGCPTKSTFGHESRADYDVAWIPHPSGRCRAYNVDINRARARRSLLWVMGARRLP